MVMAARRWTWQGLGKPAWSGCSSGDWMQMVISVVTVEAWEGGAGGIAAQGADRDRVGEKKKKRRKEGKKKEEKEEGKSERREWVLAGFGGAENW